MDEKMLVSALLTIPIVIILGAVTFTNFADNSRTSFEATQVNEFLGNTTSTHTSFTTDVFVSQSTTPTFTFYNFTTGWDFTNATSNNVNVTIVYNQGYALANVTVFGNETGVSAYMNYTGYTGTAYTSFNTIRGQTYSGYNLAGLLPFITIALAIVGLIVGALAYTKYN